MASRGGVDTAMKTWMQRGCGRQGGQAEEAWPQREREALERERIPTIVEAGVRREMADRSGRKQRRRRRRNRTKRRRKEKEKHFLCNKNEQTMFCVTNGSDY